MPATHRPGPYQLQAAINAAHTDADSVQATDWPRILSLYDHLMELAPTPVIALNRAIALDEVVGPEAALPLVDQLDLTGYYAFHATRADLLRRLGRRDQAADAYEAAGRPRHQHGRTEPPHGAGRYPAQGPIRPPRDFRIARRVHEPPAPPWCR